VREAVKGPTGAGQEGTAQLVAPGVRTARAAALVFAAYYIGARIGFALTLKPHPVSTLWPPNSILLAALLMTPARSWWVLLLAAFPAHLAVELGVGVPAPMVFCWFVSNCTEALIGASCVRGLIKGPLRFDRVRHVGIFIVCAFLATLLSSYLDAAFVTLNRWGGSGYWDVWRVRVFSNSLASLTLVPVIAAWRTGRVASVRRWPGWRSFEAGLLTAALLTVCSIVFLRQAGPHTSPALLYTPLPLLLWASMRFGPRGTSAYLLIVTFMAIWGATRGLGPFLTGSPAENTLSIQLFLIVIAVPLMILAAALRERERAEDEARQNEARLTLALSAAQMGTWDWDIPAGKASWSAKVRQIFGRSDADSVITPENLLKLMSPEDRPSVSQAISRAVERGDQYEAEFRVPMPDGSVRWVMSKGKAMLDGAGRPVRVVGVQLDITQRKVVEEVLRESEERFRLIADSTPAYLWMASAAGENSFINTTLATFLGTEDHEVGPRWASFVHPDDVAAVTEEFQQALKAQCAFRLEFRMRRHDGEYRWMINLGVPRWSPQGEFLGFAGSLVDVTERKHAEDALREREAQLRLVTDTLPAFVAYVDRDQRYRFNNRVCEHWHARSRTEMFGKSVREVVGEELYAAVRPYIERALAGESVTFEAELLIPGLGMRSHLVTHAPDVDADGRVRGFVSLGYDITDRKRAEAALRSSEERFAKAFRSSPDAIVITRHLGTRIIEINERSAAMFGYSRAEAIGRSAVELGMFAQAQDHHRLRALIAVQGYVRDFEMDMRTRSGEVLRAVVAAETVDMEGDCCVIMIIRDVTEQKRAELEAAEQRRELAHLGRVVSLGELSGALAHELSQPLAAILTNARAAQRLLTSDPSNVAEVHEILEDIAEDDRRAGGVIHRLRALLRKGEMQLQSLDLNGVVVEVLELMHSELIQRRVFAETRLAPSLPWVSVDRVQVQQVLLNLIVNACEAMPAERPGEQRLTIVTALTDEGAVRLSMTDEGSGIPEGLIERVFEPFVTSKRHGVGLGLTICRSIVTAHGGRLWAVNNPEGGATFHLVLSAAIPETGSDAVSS
jgi:PAS domain S-box-containing protein